VIVARQSQIFRIQTWHGKDEDREIITGMDYGVHKEKISSSEFWEILVLFWDIYLSFAFQRLLGFAHLKSTTDPGDPFVATA
jgi:hypothetical protein